MSFFKKYLLLAPFVFTFCKSPNKENKGKIHKRDSTCVSSSYNESNENMLSLKFDKFKILFLKVKSIDLPSDDFDFTNIKDTLIVEKKFLESDDLFNRSFVFVSKKVDSVNISANYRSDLVFYGFEKKEIAFGNETTISKPVNCYEGIYTPNIVSQNINLNGNNLSKAINLNKKYYNTIIHSDAYSEKDKINASKKLKLLNTQDNWNSDDLLVKNSNLETILNIKYYIGSKRFNKVIIM